MIPQRDPFAEFVLLISGETATSLGRTGKRLKNAIDALVAHDREGAGRSATDRQTLLQDAADALHAYVIQKELNGITDHRLLDEVYAVSAEIWAQMGVTRRSSTR